MVTGVARMPRPLVRWKTTTTVTVVIVTVVIVTVVMVNSFSKNNFNILTTEENFEGQRFAILAMF